MREAELLFACAALLVAAEGYYRSRYGGRRLGGPQDEGGASRHRAQQNVPPRCRPLAVKHERLGHVVVVGRGVSLTTADAEAFARAFSSSPRVDVVLQDRHGIGGELRLPGLVTDEPLYLDESSASSAAEALMDSLLAAHTRRNAPWPAPGVAKEAVIELRRSYTTTSVTECGTRYVLDARSIMFSSGNGTERMRCKSDIDASGETVVDMFAGIGYFTLPLARSAQAPSRIHAIEKNELSARCLVLGCIANAVESVVQVHVGDNRDVGAMLEGKCDRVLMGYLPDASPFLQQAVRFLRKKANSSDAATPAGNPGPRGHPRGRNGSGNSPPMAPGLEEEGEGRDSNACTFLLEGRVGWLHYHFLAASKAAAASTAHLALLEAFGEDAVEHVEVRAVRVVKSFAPKKFHCVADIRVAFRGL